MVVSVLDQRNPRHILLIIELVQMLHQEGLILELQVENAHPTFILWSAN